jgi:hypothetical protein
MRGRDPYQIEENGPALTAQPFALSLPWQSG